MAFTLVVRFRSLLRVVSYSLSVGADDVKLCGFVVGPLG